MKVPDNPAGRYIPDNTIIRCQIQFLPVNTGKNELRKILVFYNLFPKLYYTSIPIRSILILPVSYSLSMFGIMKNMKRNDFPDKPVNTGSDGSIFT